MRNKLTNCVEPKTLLPCRAVIIAPKWHSNICSTKKTHRFEPFKYLYLRIMSITGGQTNTMRHNYLYRYFRDTVPQFQNALKPVPSMILIGHVLAYERSKFLHARLLLCCKELVTGEICGKYESRCGCLVGVPDIMACSFGCTFSRCALMLLVVEW